MGKAFLVDIAHCNGCHNCQIACKDEHCEQSWLPYAAEQPLTGQFWMRVTGKVRGQVPVVKMHYTPTLCAHCTDAPCESACAYDAFNRREDGLLLVDPGACTGCGACVAACPIDAVFMNEVKGIAQKCTGCAHLLDDGWTIPRCVDACAVGALRFGEEGEFADELEDAVCLPGLEDAGAKVYYLNIPGRFVAATVADLSINEVIIGAKVVVTDDAGMVAATAITDEFGDFLIDGLEPGIYAVEVEAWGYAKVTLAADLTEQDISFGDVPMKKR